METDKEESFNLQLIVTSLLELCLKLAARYFPFLIQSKVTIKHNFVNFMLTITPSFMKSS